MQSAHNAAAGRAGGPGLSGMIELLRTNDAVLLSWSQALLKDAGIAALVYDGHMSILEGSIGILQRRLMVGEDEAQRARFVLAEAGVELPGGPAEATGGLTDDGFLGGRLNLLQPRHGFRAGSDSVLLAAAVAAAPASRVLDAGAGVGAVALALAWRLGTIAVDALELQATLAGIAAENARRNRLANRVAVHAGDLARPPEAIRRRPYDHVVTNPPYHDPGRTQHAPDAGRALARSEAALPLAGWLAACLALLRAGGTLTLIQRADRLDEVLAALAPAAGDVVVYPLRPGPDKAAKRVIVRALKGAAGPVRRRRGLLLHGADGAYTPAAEAVLRDGAALDLDATEG